MSNNIFIPAGIKDKSTRDTFISVVKAINNFNTVIVQNDDPDQYTPGAPGDVIYAESTNSIWVFSGATNSWTSNFTPPAGTDGLNSATIFLYNKSLTNNPPTLFSGTFTYTFADSSTIPPTASSLVTSGNFNGWTTTPPTLSENENLFVSIATASSRTATDTIPFSEFSTPAIMSSAPYNSAIVSLYQTSADGTNPPSDPTGTFDYTFNTGNLVGQSGANFNSWSQSPTDISNGEYLWLIQASAFNNTAADSIAASEFSAAAVAGVGGVNGNSAKLLVLNATSQVFTFDKDNTADPSNQNITFTAFLENTVASTATFTTNPSVTLTGSGNTRTLSVANFGSNDSVTVTATADSAVSDTFTIYRLKDGATGAAGSDALTLILSNESHTFAADNLGIVASYGSSGTDITLFEGVTPILYDGVGNSNGTFNVTASASGITAGTITDGGNFATVSDHSAMTLDNATITYTITGKRSSGITFSFTKTQSFSKSKQGAEGLHAQEYGLLSYDDLYYSQLSTSNTFGIDTSLNGNANTGFGYGVGDYMLLHSSSGGALTIDSTTSTGINVAFPAGSSNNFVHGGSASNLSVTHLILLSHDEDNTTAASEFEKLKTVQTTSEIRFEWLTYGGRTFTVTNVDFVHELSPGYLIYCFAVTQDSSSISTVPLSTDPKPVTFEINKKALNRGAGRWHISVNSLPTSSSAANAAFSITGGPVNLDQAWFYTGTIENPTNQSVWIYDSSTSAWIQQTEVIDGNLLVSGTITSSKIQVDNLSAIQANLGQVNVTKNLRLTGDNSGFIAGRTDQSTYNANGFYIGREARDVFSAGNFVVGLEYAIVSVGTTDFELIGADNNNVGTTFKATGVGSGSGTATLIGFEVSHTSVINSKIQGVIHSEEKGLQILNPLIYTGGSSSGGISTITTVSNVNAGDAGQNITVSIYGGGGAGGYGNDNGYATTYSGSGGSTTVKIWAGVPGASGSVELTPTGGVTAAGGAGGQNASLGSPWVGEAGEASIFGPGGAGGAAQSGGNNSPSLSAGGGGAGGDGPQFFDASGGAGRGGESGEVVTITVDTSSYIDTKQIYVQVYAIGTGGVPTTGGSYSGSSGGGGAVTFASVLGGMSQYTAGDLALGSGTWNTVTRTTTATYQNTHGKPIGIYYKNYYGGAKILINDVNNRSTARVIDWTDGDADLDGGSTFMIPKDYYYWFDRINNPSSQPIIEMY